MNDNITMVEVLLVLVLLVTGGLLLAGVILLVFSCVHTLEFALLIWAFLVA